MVKIMEIRNKSLNEIYGWEPMKPEQNTYVLRTAARAMQLPLKDLSPEEIRLLVTQKVGLRYVLPLAIEILKHNPMAKTCHYPGDLLEACKRLLPSDWKENSTELLHFQQIVQAAEPRKVMDFETPCGRLLLENAAGEQIPFLIAHEVWDFDNTVYDDIAQKTIPLETDYQYTVRIPASSLKIGETYIIRLCGDCTCRYGDSDEGAAANLVTAEHVTLSLGAEDLNDAEKNRQAVPLMRGGVRIGLQEPEQYDLSKFRGYIVFPLSDWSGFRFTLLDESCLYIRFRIAWIEHTIPYADPEKYYAVTNWTIF